MKYFLIGLLLFLNGCSQKVITITKVVERNVSIAPQELYYTHLQYPKDTNGTLLLHTLVEVYIYLSRLQEAYDSCSFVLDNVRVNYGEQ